MGMEMEREVKNEERREQGGSGEGDEAMGGEGERLGE